MAWSDWNWAGAGPEFRKAIELYPNFAYARAYYSHYLMVMRRPGEAMTQMRRALELDPLNGLFRALYSVDLFWVRRYDDAIRQARQALRTTPDNPVARVMLWNAYARKGMDKAATDAAKAYLAIYADSKTDRTLEQGYAEGGYKLAMRRVADELAVHSRTSFVSPFDIANCFLDGGTGRVLSIGLRKVTKRAIPTCRIWESRFSTCCQPLVSTSYAASKTPPRRRPRSSGCPCAHPG